MKPKRMKTIIVCCCAFLLAILAEACAAEETSPMNAPQAILTVDTEAPSIPYSRMLFGGFLEHFDHQVYGGVFEPGSPLADEQGFRKDVIEAVKELGVPIVRWPGGCYVSGYHWENGVGKDRRPTDDMAWGVVEPNTFGTDEFVELCRVAGWEPYICNNAGNGTVEEMRHWVEYCNGNDGKYAQMRKDSGYDASRNVTIWSIGNENWGKHEIGYKPVEQWAPFVLEAAKAMKAADPNIQMSAAALPNREWTLPLLKMAGKYLDYISIHGYWLPLWQENNMPDYLTCIMKSEEPENLIANYIGVLAESGHRGRIKIAFDEWNLRGWHHPGFPRKEVQDYADPEVIRLVGERDKNDIPSQYTMADALFSASFFNACLRHAEDVGMANIAPIVNTRGPLYVHPGGLVRRTHFHAMALYANELEARVGSVEIKADKLTQGDQSIPVVDAVATVDASGNTWAFALVNRHPEKEVACTVKMKEALLEGTYAAVILAGDSAESYNDMEHPDRVKPVETTLTFNAGVARLLPHSLTIVKVPQKSLPLPGEVFSVQDRTAFVILPKETPANGPIPWVWYAPTLPGLPGKEEQWMFERFTDAGCAIAGIDVGESFGSPDGQALYSALYDELTGKRGFAPKPVMLGRSRGGLMTLAWAVTNPDKVAGFAGIYPVCNLASYPGVDKACGAYHLTPEELAAQGTAYNPIDRLAALAKANVPLFAIHGDSDTTVPLEENSGEMQKRYEALGGKMQLIIPPGQGHNMWNGFFQCQELVDFVLAQTKRTAAAL